MRMSSINATLLGAAVIISGLTSDPAAASVVEPTSEVSTVELGENVYRSTVFWGPMSISARDAEGPGSLEQIAGLSGWVKWLASMFVSVADYRVYPPCERCFITRFEPNLVFADGSIANFDSGVMMHHANNLDISREDLACDPGTDGAAPLLGFLTGGNRVFMGAGNERTVGKLPQGYGYEVDSDSEWVVSYHLMNMSWEPKTVYFKYTFDWVLGGVKPALPLQMGVGMCSDYTYQSPAGYSDAHQDWQVDRSGYMLATSGHIHDYGISVGIENLTRNRPISVSHALYEEAAAHASAGENPNVDEMHPASCKRTDDDPHGLESYLGHIADMEVGYPNARFEKGDTFRLHAQYYHREPGTADMGVMLTYIAPDFCLLEDTWCL